MTYRGGIGGNAPTGPVGYVSGRRRLRMSVDRTLSVIALVVTLTHVAWEVAS